MDDSGEPRIPQRHVAEVSAFFAAHDRWLFGYACVRTRGDRELAADLVQDTFEAAARAWATLRRHAEGRQRAWHVLAFFLDTGKKIVNALVKAGGKNVLCGHDVELFDTG